MIQNTPPSHPAARWLVIVNPRAAQGRSGREWSRTADRLARLLPDREIVMSTHAGAATQLVAAAAARGIRHVLAVGGDGTAHQVVNGIAAQTVVPSREITFALLPLGTGNDWIKTHGIPRDWLRWREYFTTARPAYQNLGEIRYATAAGPARRYFMNVAGLAYDAHVVRFTAERPTRLPGRLFYLWATLRCLWDYTPQRATLRFNDEQITDDFYTVNVGIGRYSGGGMQLVPQAEPAAAAMALTYVGRVSKAEVVLNAHRFYGGAIRGYAKARLTQAERVVITPAPGAEVLIEADGEFLGRCPTEISVVRDALCFLKPIG